MTKIKKNIFKFIIAIIFALTLGNNVSAGNTCVKNSLSIQEIITSLLPGGTILNSAASTYMQHFDMTSAEGSSCRVPSTQVKYNVNQAFIFNSLISISDVNNPMTSYPNSSAEYFLIYPGTKIEVLKVLLNPLSLSGSFMKLSRIETADKVCLQAIPPGLGFLTSWVINLQFPLGCKYTPDPSSKQTFQEFSKNAKPTQKNIITIGTCLETNTSENTFSLSAFYPIVNCINQATNMLFFNKLYPEQTLSHVILKIFKPFIIAMLTISVIIFGMKFALGAAMKKQEIFLFVIKIVVVMSFTLGKNFPNIPPYDSGISSPNGVQFIQKFFQTLTNGFSLIGSTLDISNTNNHHLEEKGYVSNKNIWSTLCNLGQSKNSPSNNPPALIIFKEVDCRISYYLGINLSNALDTVTSADPIPSKSFFTASDHSMLNIPSLALFSFSFLFCLMSFIFVLLIISVFISVVHVYCIAMIVQSILIIFAPLMIPCLLFQYTKGYYDSWIRLLLSFSLQPMIYILALSLMFATFDVIAVGDCQYEANEVNITIPVINNQNNSNETNTITTIKELKLVNHPKSKTCKLSLLYRLQHLQKSNNIFYIGSFTSFLQPKMLSNQFFTQMLFPLLAIILCSLVFYVMLEALDDFAATLSGGPPLGQLAISPTKFITSLVKGANALRKAAKKDQKPDEDAEVNENNNSESEDAQISPRNAGSNLPGGGSGANAAGGDGGSGANAAAAGGSGTAAAAGGSGGKAAAAVAGAAIESRREDTVKDNKEANNAGGLAAASSTDEKSSDVQTRARAPIDTKSLSTPKSDE